MRPDTKGTIDRYVQYGLPPGGFIEQGRYGEPA